MDACFKLKCKDRGLNDPELGSGTAYMVQVGDYLSHLSKYVDEPEVGMVHVLRARAYYA